MDVVHRFGTAALLVAVALELEAADHVPDAPAPLVETGIRMLDQVPGKFAWLDSNTLAVTTYGDEKVQFPWTVRKIVAFNVKTRAAKTLVTSGFLSCTNPEVGLVSLHVGDLQSMYVGGSKSPPPVQEFHVWNSSRGELTPAAATYKTEWNAIACLKTEPEDVAGIDWMFGRKPIRYLQARHGVIKWESVYTSASEPLVLQNGKKTTLLSIKSDELGSTIPYLPFRKAYEVRPAIYQNGTQPKVDKPLITMQADGTITRTPIPAALKQHLDKLDKYASANMISAGPGNLAVAGGRHAQGGGLYLVQGERAKRVWCTAPAPESYAARINEPCRIEQGIAVSPDGCKVAFDSKVSDGSANLVFSLSGTVKIIDLCAAARASNAVPVQTAVHQRAGTVALGTSESVGERLGLEYR